MKIIETLEDLKHYLFDLYSDAPLNYLLENSSSAGEHLDTVEVRGFCELTLFASSYSLTAFLGTSDPKLENRLSESLNLYLGSVTENLDHTGSQAAPYLGVPRFVKDEDFRKVIKKFAQGATTLEWQFENRAIGTRIVVAVVIKILSETEFAKCRWIKPNHAGEIEFF